MRPRQIRRWYFRTAIVIIHLVAFLSKRPRQPPLHAPMVSLLAILLELETNPIRPTDGAGTAKLMKVLDLIVLNSHLFLLLLLLLLLSVPRLSQASQLIRRQLQTQAAQISYLRIKVVTHWTIYNHTMA